MIISLLSVPPYCPKHLHPSFKRTFLNAFPQEEIMEGWIWMFCLLLSLKCPFEPRYLLFHSSIHLTSFISWAGRVFRTKVLQNKSLSQHAFLMRIHYSVLIFTRSADINQYLNCMTVRRAYSCLRSENKGGKKEGKSLSVLCYTLLQWHDSKDITLMTPNLYKQKHAKEDR